MKLRGNCPAKVDEKGRLKIPAVYLEALKELGSNFYITSRNGREALIFPMPVWSAIEDKLSSLPSSNKSKRKFLFHTSYYGQAVEVDAQGRVLLPSVLRDAAQLKGDVDVLGSLDHMVVMSHARAEEQLKSEPYTDSDDDALEIAGI